VSADLLEPVHELDVRVAAQLAEDGRALDRLGTRGYSACRRARAADVAHLPSHTPLRRAQIVGIGPGSTPAEPRRPSEPHASPEHERRHFCFFSTRCTSNRAAKQIEAHPVHQLLHSCPAGRKLSYCVSVSGPTPRGNLCCRPRRGGRAPRQDPSVAPSRFRYVRSPGRATPVPDELLNLHGHAKKCWRIAPGLPRPHVADERAHVKELGRDRARRRDRGMPSAIREERADVGGKRSSSGRFSIDVGCACAQARRTARGTDGAGDRGIAERRIARVRRRSRTNSVMWIAAAVGTEQAEQLT